MLSLGVSFKVTPPSGDEVKAAVQFANTETHPPVWHWHCTPALPCSALNDLYHSADQ